MDTEELARATQEYAEEVKNLTAMLSPKTGIPDLACHVAAINSGLIVVSTLLLRVIECLEDKE